jgi:uncharacterized membrane protein YdbT with pleckstrin-like domain
VNPKDQAPQQLQPLGGPKPRIPGQQRQPVLTPEVLAKHQESKRKYPQLSLSAGEYVIEEVRRHPIGLISIWALTVFLVLVILVALPFYGIQHDLIAQTLMIPAANLPSAAIMTVPALILIAFFVLGGVIATYIYEGNKFYITSESIVQFIQTGLFSTKQQTVNLINVEDASSEQHGILEQFLNFGVLKLSTQGEETTYHFQFVSNPKRVVNVINDASERAVKILQGYPASEY